MLLQRSDSPPPEDLEPAQQSDLSSRLQFYYPSHDFEIGPLPEDLPVNSAPKDELHKNHRPDLVFQYPVSSCWNLHNHNFNL